MKNLKRYFAALTAALATLILLAGCTEKSEPEANAQQVGYDPAAAVAPYLANLPEMTEDDLNYTVQLGLFDCDHMVAALIGQDAGIYEALGMSVEVTMTNVVTSAVSAGQLDVAYANFIQSVLAYNSGASIVSLTGSHLGGARYFVVRKGIEYLSHIESLTVSDASMTNPEWLRFAHELGINNDYSAYEGAIMSQRDSLVALRAGRIDGIFVCDPYASMAEEEDLGFIINVGWGSLSEELGIGWGQCCNPIFYKPFTQERPALAARMVLANYLATQYMYLHPYNAAMIFADTFGTSPGVGLRTIFLKTNAEGRTMNWELTPQNLQNLIDYRIHWGVPESDWPQITRGETEDFFDLSFEEMIGLKSFEEFEYEHGLAERFPIGMSYTDWLHMAETVDGIPHDSPVGKGLEKWMSGEFITFLHYSPDMVLSPRVGQPFVPPETDLSPAAGSRL